MLEFTLSKNFSTIESIISEEDWHNIFYNNKSLVSQQYYNFYYSYGNSWKPESVLEIGVRFGYSAVSMAVGAGNSLKKFVGIDLEIDVNSSSNIAKNNLQKHTQAEVQLFNFDTQKDNIPDDIGTFDLIHVDADHTFYGCINDILLALSLSKFGTKIIVDDCLYAPVRAAVEAIKKVYSTRLEVKYVTNYRGHGLIQTLDTFPELLNHDQRYAITHQQESPFPKIAFSSIADHYSRARKELSNSSDNLASNGSNLISQVITQVDLYLVDAVQKINSSLKFYQDNGFSIDSIIKVLSILELNKSNTNINNRNKENIFFVKNIFAKSNNLYREIYDKLYNLNQLRLNIIANPIGKCFSYFCRESTKHFDYLAARIDKECDSSSLPPQLPGLDTQNKGNIFITYEGHSLLTVLSDALINILSCFERELESQYWMQYWDIKNNKTWNNLIKSTKNNPSDSPTPFPVKESVEYDDFYKLQHIGNAGGMRLKNITSTNKTYSEKQEIDVLHPTDHLFRIYTTISHIQLILKLLQERYPGETIKWLDVGCGIGFISNRVQFDGVVIGIDVAESLVEYANATRLTENHKYITGNFSDARNMIGGEKFHLITANEVVEHIFDPLSFIGEMSQHTADLIYASSPLMEPVPYHPAAEHLWSFTLESYMRLFEESGMKITYSGMLHLGKYLGECHNWLSVAATIKHPFRILPLS